MNTYRLKTDLSCESCVETLKSTFQGEAGIDSWEVDLKSKDKVLTIHGTITEPGITRLVNQAGYKVLGTANPISSTEVSIEPQKTFFQTYYPLILIFSYLLGFTLLRQYGTGAFHANEAMLDFMGGFFAVFSFFKILNLKGFADAYATYDIFAKRSRTYGFIYPFLELLLGVAYLGRFSLHATSLFTVFLMAVSSIGVFNAVTKKSKIQCACLGTVFNLPMTYVTLFEDGLMLVMALASLMTKTIM